MDTEWLFGRREDRAGHMHSLLFGDKQSGGGGNQPASHGGGGSSAGPRGLMTPIDGGAPGVGGLVGGAAKNIRDAMAETAREVVRRPSQPRGGSGGQPNRSIMTGEVIDQPAARPHSTPQPSAAPAAQRAHGGVTRTGSQTMHRAVDRFESWRAARQAPAAAPRQQPHSPVVETNWRGKPKRG